MKRKEFDKCFLAIEGGEGVCQTHNYPHQDSYAVCTYVQSYRAAEDSIKFHKSDMGLFPPVVMPMKNSDYDFLKMKPPEEYLDRQPHTTIEKHYLGNVCGVAIYADTDNEIAIRNIKNVFDGAIGGLSLRPNKEDK